MAVTFATARALGFGAATTHDLTSVVVSGTDRVLYVWVGNRTSIANVTSVVLDPGGANEAALTLVESEGDVTASDGIYVTLHRLINPPTGTFTVRITITTSGRLTAGAISVNGAHQTTPERTLAKNMGTGTDADIAGIASNANDLVLVCINSRQASGGTTHTEDAGQTARWDDVVTTGGGGSSQHRSSGSTEPGASSVDVGYTLGNSQGWAMVAVSVQEAAGGGGTTHLASVAFSSAATSAFNATRLLAASVAYSGTGAAAFNASRLLAAGVSFTGAGTAAFNANLLLSASASFTGAATFAASPIAIRLASFAAQGVATFAANGEIVPSGPQTHLGSVAFAGAGQFSASPIVIRAAAVAYTGAATFTGNPVAILQAAAQFTGVGYFAAAGDIFDPSNIRATLIRGMRDIRSNSGMGSVRTRAELGGVATTASISEVN